MRESTIVAVSSGIGRAAIAVVRTSGSRVRFVVETILQCSLLPRVARVVTVHGPCAEKPLDRCLALYFEGPRSATGEDVLELHLHGGTAVVQAVMARLTQVNGIRLAEPGEFTRRALENGKLDLLQVEALGDLLNAETRAQLDQAQRQLSGELGRLALEWRERLVSLRAGIEAELDFSDEGDVPGNVLVASRPAILDLAAAIEHVLGQAEHGRRIREGVSVVVLGAPNAGKSMLMNALAGRDVAIVSDRKGTTRDLLEAPIDCGGWPVILVDTAGLHATEDGIEREGIRRAMSRASSAELILLVSSWDVEPVTVDAASNTTVIRVGTKCDQQQVDGVDVRVSGLTQDGIDDLRSRIAEALGKTSQLEPALVARERHRVVLSDVILSLRQASESAVLELMAEDLRRASFMLGRLVGETDLETVLDRLFEGFCIGK